MNADEQADMERTTHESDDDSYQPHDDDDASDEAAGDTFGI
jgi:hypothetical protein